MGGTFWLVVLVAVEGLVLNYFAYTALQEIRRGQAKSG